MDRRRHGERPAAVRNWGASSVQDALNNTWRLAYCAKHTASTECIDPTAASGFETTATPPLGAATIARFDTADCRLE